MPKWLIYFGQINNELLPLISFLTKLVYICVYTWELRGNRSIPRLPRSGIVGEMRNRRTGTLTIS